MKHRSPGVRPSAHRLPFGSQPARAARSRSWRSRARRPCSARRRRGRSVRRRSSPAHRAAIVPLPSARVAGHPMPTERSGTRASPRALTDATRPRPPIRGVVQRRRAVTRCAARAGAGPRRTLPRRRTDRVPRSSRAGHRWRSPGAGRGRRASRRSSSDAAARRGPLRALCARPRRGSHEPGGSGCEPRGRAGRVRRGDQARPEARSTARPATSKTLGRGRHDRAPRG